MRNWLSDLEYMRDQQPVLYEINPVPFVIIISLVLWIAIELAVRVVAR